MPVVCQVHNPIHKSLDDHFAASYELSPAVHKPYEQCTYFNNRHVFHPSYSDIVIVTTCIIKWDQMHWSIESTFPVTLG